ncbi:hypothetical protein [Pajaroellobacter abortibovis]|uniref:hypothetical protein n=1 Tax=Pajaroellobacter abortibovis TaxID=1882918 RepID=UPI0012EBBB94|nr:hypothetical protein [Pajaroellobacter abortibovis]
MCHAIDSLHPSILLHLHGGALRYRETPSSTVPLQCLLFCTQEPILLCGLTLTSRRVGVLLGDWMVRVGPEMKQAR